MIFYAFWSLWSFYSLWAFLACVCQVWAIDLQLHSRLKSASCCSGAHYVDAPPQLLSLHCVGADALARAVVAKAVGAWLCYIFTWYSLEYSRFGCSGLVSWVASTIQNRARQSGLQPRGIQKALRLQTLSCVLGRSGRSNGSTEARRPIVCFAVALRPAPYEEGGCCISESHSIRRCNHWKHCELCWSSGSADRLRRMPSDKRKGSNAALDYWVRRQDSTTKKTKLKSYTESKKHIMCFEFHCYQDDWRLHIPTLMGTLPKSILISANKMPPHLRLIARKKYQTHIAFGGRGFQ